MGAVREQVIYVLQSDRGGADGRFFGWPLEEARSSYRARRGRVSRDGRRKSPAAGRGEIEYSHVASSPPRKLYIRRSGRHVLLRNASLERTLRHFPRQTIIRYATGSFRFEKKRSAPPCDAISNTDFGYFADSLVAVASWSCGMFGNRRTARAARTIACERWRATGRRGLNRRSRG